MYLSFKLILIPFSSSEVPFLEFEISLKEKANPFKIRPKHYHFPCRFPEILKKVIRGYLFPTEYFYKYMYVCIYLPSIIKNVIIYITKFFKTVLIKIIMSVT